MPAPTTPLRAVSLLPLYIGIRSALLANTTITSLIGQDVFRNGDVVNTDSSYLIVTGLLYKPQNTYTSTEGCFYCQLSGVSFGSPDDADTLMAAAATALLDTAWAITGYDVLDVRLGPSLPDVPPVVQAKVVWTRRDRYEVTVRLQQ